MQNHNPSVRPRIRLPNLRYVSLSGVPTVFAVLILDVCPNIETLELTRLERLSDLVPLPLAVRTPVLVHPSVALSEEEAGSWALSEALDAGLFPVGEKPPRIVVRSGTPDSASFLTLRRDCERFNISKNTSFGMLLSDPEWLGRPSQEPQALRHRWLGYLRRLRRAVPLIQAIKETQEKSSTGPARRTFADECRRCP